MTYDEETMLPDSMKRCVAAAVELWELKILNKEPINIMFLYEELPLTDVFVVERAVMSADDDGLLFPTSYLRQISNDVEYDNIDGLIILNSALKWNCDFSGNSVDGYNVTTQALRGIGICLGFGSSICPYEDSYIFSGENPTIFDSRLNFGDKLLTEISHNTPEFTQAVHSNNVNFLTKNGRVHPMKSSNFDSYNQLVYLDNSRCLMHYDCGESNSFMSIDDTTIEILQEIGWNQEKPSVVKIKADDLDVNGFGSASVSHTFSYDSETPLSSLRWEYSLRKADGTFELKKESTTTTFTIPNVESTEGYYIDTNGNLLGKITVFGKDSKKQSVSDTYIISLGLKPIIVAIRNIQQIPTGEYTFILQFDVEYLGADFLNISIESDNSSKLNQWKYTEPIIAHVKTTELYNFYYHWVDIIVKNEHGTTVETIEVPDTYNFDNTNQNQYFIKISDPQYIYEIEESGNRITGDFSFDIITNYPDRILVEVTTPYMYFPWMVKHLVSNHPIYKRFKFNYNAANGFKIKATIPNEKIESNILNIDDFITASDLEAITGVEEVSCLDNLKVCIEKNKIVFNRDYCINGTKFEMLDLNGKLIASETFNMAHYEFDISNIPHGIYVLCIKSDNTQLIKKIAL